MPVMATMLFAVQNLGAGILVMISQERHQCRLCTPAKQALPMSSCMVIASAADNWQEHLVAVHVQAVLQFPCKMQIDKAVCVSRCR